MLPIDALLAAFGQRLRQQQPLARYTSARIGGKADALLEVTTQSELAEAARTLWDLNQPFFVLGGGSNVLISDAGVRQVVILNQAGDLRFAEGEHPSVWAESGAGLGVIARQAASKGLGIAYSYPYIFQQELQEKKVMRLLEKYTPFDMEVYVFYHPSSYTPLKITSFVKALQAFYQNLMSNR